MTEEVLRPEEVEIIEILKGSLYSRFRRMYAYTHRITCSTPIQPSNEIRNAIDHFNRALNISDEASIRRNMNNGKGHILRATNDCFAISIAHRLEAMSDLIAAMEKKGKRREASELLREFRQISDAAQAIFPALVPQPVDDHGEPTSDLDALAGLYNSLMRVLMESNQLYKKLRDALTFHEAVDARAYGIWQREGRPEGRQDEHWKRAAAELGGVVAERAS